MIHYNPVNKELSIHFLKKLLNKLRLVYFVKQKYS
jgi:hypothetical protein